MAVRSDILRVGAAGLPLTRRRESMLADAFGRPYASHGGEAAHMCVMACLPNTHYVELGLLSPDDPMKLVDGCVNLPQGPGFSWE